MMGEGPSITTEEALRLRHGTAADRARLAGLAAGDASLAEELAEWDRQDAALRALYAPVAEEEQALTGPKMLFDTAVQGRQLDMMGIASYFRQKLSIAPAGDAPKAAEKASDAAAQPSAAK